VTAAYVEVACFLGFAVARLWLESLLQLVPLVHAAAEVLSTCLSNLPVKAPPSVFLSVTMQSGSMHQVLQREFFKRVDYERSCASEGGGGLIAVTLERTALTCTVLCQVPAEEMPRLKTGARGAFASEDVLGCVQWKYQAAVVRSFSGTRIELSRGWPEESSWTDACFMSLWSNESESPNLSVPIDTVLKEPSWLRDVHCENVEAEQYEQRCRVQDDDPSR